jgi:hypothetical protein
VVSPGLFSYEYGRCTISCSWQTEHALENTERDPDSLVPAAEGDIHMEYSYD